MKSLPLFIFLLVLLNSCSEEKVYIPKQRAYAKIELTPQEYIALSVDTLPYTIEINKNAIAMADKGRNAEKYWIDIYYPTFDANVLLTYKNYAGDAAALDELVKDARTLVAKHQVKATGIAEGEMKLKDGSPAYLFEITGEVPSQFQFYTAADNKHFLRGALYFKTANKNDSLTPVIKYIAEDMKKIISSVEWKKPSK